MPFCSKLHICLPCNDPNKKFDPSVGYRSRPNRNGFRTRFNDEVQFNDGDRASLIYADDRENNDVYVHPSWNYPIWAGPGSPPPEVHVEENIAPHLIPGGGRPFLVGPPGTNDSDITLYSDREIRAPPAAYFSGAPQRNPAGSTAPLRIRKKKPAMRRSASRRDLRLPENNQCGPRMDRQLDMPSKGGEGIISVLADLYNSENYNQDDYPEDDIENNNDAVTVFTTDEDRFKADDDDNWILDPDDPRITGIVKEHLEDREDVEKSVMRHMSYRSRRKYRARLKIEFNITSVLHRQKFLMRLAKALMTYGAPSHRIEAQLSSAARILEVDSEFIHIPGVIICSFGDQDTKSSETHFVKCGGRLSLGSLHEVHQIYRAVVHDELSAKKGYAQLGELLKAEPLYGFRTRCFLAFIISSLICPLAFGGSLVDMWVAGAGATFLCWMQVGYASKSQLYANVFEVTMTMTMSFLARALSSIHGNMFCYTAISSASIVGILPGFLILSSSLELASKNIVCGSVKLVYALIYTLFLGFGLQIGSDIYLLLDPQARHEISHSAANFTTPDSAKFTGLFVSDNGTARFGPTEESMRFLAGTFTFYDAVPIAPDNVFKGCYRPPDAPWWMRPFPWWSQFILVPIFSVFSSLANLQPLWTWEMVVMVIISCCAYAANKIADHFIFNRSDMVSCIGAIAVGLLGNLYSRNLGGTAFTSMVTGVLFLVPSGLSQVGGLTAQGNGVDIGAAMIAVVIGITVGLFLSQAVVYAFGKRKNAAIFSF
ncbi:hypothetical protein NLI96_g1367 [Meripilus lineatus]|uniref:Threonine/serine exporter-like N-terminal domain-containing protein n=1 Tax=Meripilus lineatus TaxID=2056292 RepID=A0AAD5VD28_9APHY|nr:hypothetical protein NLI96_g8048 [Physisporinus lineatus]KAJ3490561.1 hypothetical protein NLI96_g1367 [Physisporinus lineatus]